MATYISDNFISNCLLSSLVGGSFCSEYTLLIMASHCMYYSFKVGLILIIILRCLFQWGNISFVLLPECWLSALWLVAGWSVCGITRSFPELIDSGFNSRFFEKFSATRNSLRTFYQDFAVRWDRRVQCVPQRDQLVLLAGGPISWTICRPVTRLRLIGSRTRSSYGSYYGSQLCSH